jgi:hypothetical protein
MNLCGKCKRNDIETDFFPYDKYHCKNCLREIWRLYNYKRSLYHKLYWEKWYKDPINKNNHSVKGRIYAKRWGLNNKNKCKIQLKLRRLIKNGIIKKSNQCEICNSFKTIEAHHFNYNNPLNFIWVCRSCHKNIHLALLKKIV